jgi:hypothetical protein
MTGFCGFCHKDEIHNCNEAMCVDALFEGDGYASDGVASWKDNMCQRW